MLKTMKKIANNAGVVVLSAWLGIIIGLAMFWTKIFGISKINWLVSMTGFIWIPFLVYGLVFTIIVIYISFESIIERRIDNDKRWWNQCIL